jgi:hypothetical protein
MYVLTGKLMSTPLYFGDGKFKSEFRDWLF